MCDLNRISIFIQTVSQFWQIWLHIFIGWVHMHRRGLLAFSTCSPASMLLLFHLFYSWWIMLLLYIRDSWSFTHTKLSTSIQYLLIFKKLKFFTYILEKEAPTWKTFSDTCNFPHQMDDFSRISTCDKSIFVRSYIFKGYIWKFRFCARYASRCRYTHVKIPIYYWNFMLTMSTYSYQ